MQPVDILGDQDEMIGSPFQFNQSFVTGIRLCRRDVAPAFLIPLPDQLRIAGEAFRSGEVLEPVCLPVPSVTAKRGDAALSRHTRACQNRDSPGFPDRIPLSTP